MSPFPCSYFEFDRTLVRHYDQYGRPGGISFSEDGLAPWEYNASYAYDTVFGRLNQITGTNLPAGGVNYSYVSEGDQLDRLDYGSANPNSSLAWANYTYEFEATSPTSRNLIRSVDNGFRYPSVTTVSNYSYRNDNLDRRTSVANTGSAFDPQPWHYRFGYNDRSELTGADRLTGTDPEATPPPPGLAPSDFNYVYDHIGNRRTFTLDSAQTGYTINNSLNQYDATTNPNQAFSYDADGNLLSDGVYGFTWDAENRLAWVQKENPVTGSVRLGFAYDHLGRRALTEVDTYSNGNWSLNGVLYFLYDGWNVVEVFEVTDMPTLLTQYAWGLDLSGSLQGAGGIGGLLAAYETAGTATLGDDHTYWFCYDANGNVGQVLDATDSQNISLAAKYEYDPYGNTLTASGPYAAAKRFRFSTKWLDYEPAASGQAGAVGSTGLYYYGYRYYSPGLGRWISRDPVEERGGLNYNSFVENRPLEKVDALGLFSSNWHRDLTFLGLVRAGLRLKGDVTFCPMGMLRPLPYLQGCNANTDQVFTFDARYHGQDSRWVDIVNDLMLSDHLANETPSGGTRGIQYLECCNCLDMGLLLEELGEALHILQDVHSHTDWSEGGHPNMLRSYLRHGYKDFVYYGASHTSHWNQGLPLGDLRTVASQLLYYGGGTWDWIPFNTSPHELFAADYPGFGRDKEVQSAFTCAQDGAANTTAAFFIWAYQNPESVTLRSVYRGTAFAGNYAGGEWRV